MKTASTPCITGSCFKLPLFHQKRIYSRNISTTAYSKSLIENHHDVLFYIKFAKRDKLEGIGPHLLKAWLFSDIALPIYSSSYKLSESKSKLNSSSQTYRTRGYP